MKSSAGPSARRKGGLRRHGAEKLGSRAAVGTRRGREAAAPAQGPPRRRGEAHELKADAQLAREGGVEHTPSPRTHAPRCTSGMGAARREEARWEGRGGQATCQVREVACGGGEGPRTGRRATPPRRASGAGRGATPAPASVRARRGSRARRRVAACSRAASGRRSAGATLRGGGEGREGKQHPSTISRRRLSVASLLPNFCRLLAHWIACSAFS